MLVALDVQSVPVVAVTYMPCLLIIIFKNYSSFKNKWKRKYNLFSCMIIHAFKSL
jgi:uncharacterized membrane protein YfhO